MISLNASLIVTQSSNLNNTMVVAQVACVIGILLDFDDRVADSVTIELALENDIAGVTGAIFSEAVNHVLLLWGGGRQFISGRGISDLLIGHVGQGHVVVGGVGLLTVWTFNKVFWFVKGR